MWNWLKRIFGWGEPQFTSLGSIKIDPPSALELKREPQEVNVIATHVPLGESRRVENKKKFEAKPAAAYAGYREPPYGGELAPAAGDVLSAAAEAAYWQSRHQQYAEEAAQLIPEDYKGNVDMQPTEAVPESTTPEPIIRDIQPYCQDECGWSNTPTNEPQSQYNDRPSYDPTPTPSYTPDPNPSPSYDPPSSSSGSDSSSYGGSSYDSGGSCGGDSGGGCGSCD